MKRTTTKDESRLIQYLLGQLGPEEQSRIEEQYFADADFQEELRATERDLIDRYVRGELSNPEQFEKCFLSSSTRRQKVEFARTLMQSLDEASAVAEKRTSGVSQTNPSWRAFLSAFFGYRYGAWSAAALVLVVLAAGWLILNREKQDSPNPVAQTPPQESDQPTAPPPVRPDPAPAIRVATFVLMPSLTRAVSETQTLTIEGSTELNLGLLLEAVDYQNYSAILRTAEGEEILRQNQLKPQPTSSGEAIIVKVPANLLDNRDYTIRVSAMTSTDVEEIASYYFRVRKK